MAVGDKIPACSSAKYDFRRRHGREDHRQPRFRPIAVNVTRVKSFLILAALAIIGFGPLSLTCLIGLFIVARRPDWFYRVVRNLYRDTDCGSTDCAARQEKLRSEAGMVRIKTFLCLLVLLVLDIAPVPVAGSIGLYVVVTRPCWFKTLVEKIYGGVMAPQSDA